MEHLVVDSNLNGLAVQLRQELAAQNNRLAKRIDELSVEAHALQSQVDGLSQYVDEIQKVVVRLLSDNSALQGQVAHLIAKEAGLATHFNGDFYKGGRSVSMEQYWNDHNVTLHHQFTTPAESLDFYRRRHEAYPGYIDMMPCHGQDGKVVLDFGCGPGHDLVGFALYSKPARLIGMDVSKTSLGQAQARLRLHGKEVELLHVPYDQEVIPLPSRSVDYIHCSGVLMLIERPQDTLAEFARVLKPGGEIRCMVYNYNSIWVHLYVAYFVQVKNRLYADRSLREAFARTTDGEYCPSVHVWDQETMASLGAAAGLSCEFLGAALSVWEMYLLPRRFEALLDQSLNPESRKFLLDLGCDSLGFLTMRGQRAGIDACYCLRHR